MIQPFNPGIDQQVAQYQQTSAMNDQRGRGRGGDGGNPYARMADMENADRQRSHELKMLDRQSSLRAREGEAQRAHDVRQADLDRSHQTLLHDRTFRLQENQDRLQEEQIRRQYDREDRDRKALEAMATARQDRLRKHRELASSMMGGLGATDDERRRIIEEDRKETEDFERRLFSAAAERSRQLDESGSRITGEKDKIDARIKTRQAFNNALSGDKMREMFAPIESRMRDGTAGGLWNPDAHTYNILDGAFHAGEAILDVVTFGNADRLGSSAYSKGVMAYGENGLPYNDEWISKQQGAVINNAMSVLSSSLTDSLGGRSFKPVGDLIELYLNKAFSLNEGAVAGAVQDLTSSLQAHGVDPYLVAQSLRGMKNQAANVALEIFNDSLSKGKIAFSEGSWTPGTEIRRSDLLRDPMNDESMAAIAAYNVLTRMSKMSDLAHSKLMDSALGGIETDAQLQSMRSILEEMVLPEKGPDFAGFLRGETSDDVLQDFRVPNETLVGRRMADVSLSTPFRDFVLGEVRNARNLRSGVNADRRSFGDELSEIKRNRDDRQMDVARRRQQVVGTALDDLVDFMDAQQLPPEASFEMDPFGSLSEILRIVEDMRLAGS